MENNNGYANFDPDGIKDSLNISLEEAGISVTEDLINTTIDRIKEDEKQVRNKNKFKKPPKGPYKYANIAAVIALVLIVGTIFTKNLIDRDVIIFSKSMDKSSSMEMSDPINGKEESNINSDYEQDAYEYKGEKFHTIIPLQASEIENIEISYYSDNGVINKDLTKKKEDILDLFSNYELEEINSKVEDQWYYRLTIRPIKNLGDNSVYTIIIGKNLNLTQEIKIAANSEREETSQIIRRTFQVNSIEDLKTALRQSADNGS